MLPHWIEDPNPDIYLSDNYLVLDVENTITNGDGSSLCKDNSLLLSCYTYQGQSFELWGDECHIQPLLEKIAECDFLVAHNAKHELQWLARAGFKLEDILIYDTMVGEYVLLGNKQAGLSLGAISERRGFGGKEPYVDLCMRAAICPSLLPASLLSDRCTKDVEQTHNIFLQQRKELAHRDKLKTAFTRCILTPALADIEMNGMHLDANRVREVYDRHVAVDVELGNALAELGDGINFNSPQQLSAFLYDKLGFEELKDRRGNVLRTPSGGRRTDGATLSALKATNKEQRRFVVLWSDYNKNKSALNKNLEFFKGVVEEKGCTFLGQFNQCITQTHRLSASGRRLHFGMFPRGKSVQFQNMPRVFKTLFSARNEGWNMAEADGAQLEFRVAAQLGRDTVAIDDIINNVDIHSYTAEVLTKNRQSTDRQGAKEHTFKPLYGGQSGTKAEQAYYKAFKNKYRGIASWQEDNKLHVLTNKSLTLPSGLEFFWPGTTVQRGDYITNSTQICNYPVQSLATADIIPIGITKLWYDLKSQGLESFIVNTVHDSVVAELHPDEHEVFGELSSKAFTEYVYRYLDEVYDYKWFVPLATGYKVGKHWNEGEEILYNSTPPYTL